MSSSKFSGFQMKDNFSNCNLSSNSTEGRPIAVNEKFLAISWRNGGEIMIVDSFKPVNLKYDIPLIKGYGHIYDLEFSPFNNIILSSCINYSSDNSVLLWEIPENGLKQDLKQELLNYKEHTTKVSFVNFNPVVQDLICSGAFGGEIHSWNLTKGENYAKLQADDTPTFVSWNPYGSLIGVSTKKKL